MKAKRVFIKTTPEIEQAINLNIKVPELEFWETDFFFSINAVSEAYITRDGFINALIHGREVILKYEKRVWSKIRGHLE